MKKETAIKRLASHGYTVTSSGHSYSATIGTHVIKFLESREGMVTCFRVLSTTDHDDPMRDYSAGVYCDNLTRAMRLVNCR